MQLANTVAVIFAVLAFFAPLLHHSPEQTPLRYLIFILRFWILFLCAVAASVAAARLGKYWQVWPGDPGFPSGHQAFAAAATVCLVRIGGRLSVILCVPLLVVMGFALITATAHDLRGVTGGVIVGVLVATACWYVLGRKLLPTARAAPNL
jgi:membrane-associated phospholipid phosphatase